MNQIKDYNETIFERIKHTNEYDKEYWYARELQVVLEYKRWDKFCNVIENAKIACEKSNYGVTDHFAQVGKMVKIGSRTSRNIMDYKLSRYACYLIVQNADSRKQVVALGQTYFAVQTRKQELTEKEYDNLTEDEKRFYKRSLTRKDNISSERAANETHYNIGKNIREVIAKNGGTMPEGLPTPKRSLKDLERNKKQLK